MSEEEIAESSSDEVMQDGSEIEDEDEDEDRHEDEHEEQTIQASDPKPRKVPKNPASEQEKAQAIGEMYEYKSNVFRMETDELLSEIRLDYRKKMAPVEKTLYKLKSVIEAISEKLDVHVSAGLAPLLLVE
jgi:U3 small nucleolar RNA-associated protein 22